MVWVIRTFRPDVIIRRFDEQPPNHGHHTASAILAREAFVAAGDPERFPDQLTRGVHPWKAERLLYNWSQWRGGPPPRGAIALDVGQYDPRLGLGYGELAARSRSQHKSQGFGVAGERGPILEYFVPVAGTKPTTDILDGVNTGWGRFGKPAAPLVAALDEARATLERDRPERALPALIKAHDALAALPDVPRVDDARTSLDGLIAAASGLFVRATAERPAAVPGSRVPIAVEIVLRRPVSMALRRVVFPGVAPVEEPTALGPVALGLNEKKVVSRAVPIPADASVSVPYWLAEPQLPGRQVVADLRLVGEPVGPAPLSVAVELALDDHVVRLAVPVVYAWTDRVHGERIRTFLIVPPATVTPTRQAVLFPNGKPASAVLRVRAGGDALKGNVRLNLPAGWRAEPAMIPVTLAHAGDEATVRVEVTPPANAQPVDVHPAIEVAGKSWSYREDIIDYPHIPMQVVLQPAALRLVPLALQLPKGPIGYIAGSGDTVAEDLMHVGLPVEVLDDETIRSGDLSRYASIVVGIRAYNTRAVLKGAHERLMRYVKDGGTVIVQYNTTNPRDPLNIPIGPFPLEIGRGRVTDETATMEPVDPQQGVLNVPNRIGADDFKGWVQERGLYFAETWDTHYTPIFRVHDPGEEPLLGSLLIAHYGKGRYVYTGLAFFRQLPAGVPGAYRLFANLLAGD